MIESRPFTSQLGAGLGLVEETKTLLGLWSPGMSASQLNQVALASGKFPTITARRLRNIVFECFAPRYLNTGGTPAAHLKQLAGKLANQELTQLMLLFTSRANPILADFLRQVYWPRYAAGASVITNQDARAFVASGVAAGKTTSQWSEHVIRNVAGYLTGCCADYGLLEAGHKTSRRLIPFHISAPVAAYLAYDLHGAGQSDNALLSHPDWQIFGLDRREVLAEIKRLALQGLLIVQAAGDLVHISWQQPNLEALCHVITQS